ncbi:MAG: hypothetical protein ACRD2E_10795 [Terriglobales bacterium]
MTPEEAEGAMQFVTDQQGNFATALLKMENHLEQLTAGGRRLEAQLAQLGAQLDHLAEASQRAEAERGAAQTERSHMRQELAALRTTIEALRRAA